jgi:hypothetical protein
MTRKLLIPFFAMTLALLVICTPGFGHHGTAGVYDYGHRITTKAAVKELFLKSLTMWMAASRGTWKSCCEAPSEPSCVTGLWSLAPMRGPWQRPSSCPNRAGKQFAFTSGRKLRFA